jgi:catechol 2,3-dioxygenase-like lactoylglutathione lyase family enzyme
LSTVHGFQELVASVSDIDRLARDFREVFRWSAHPLPDAPPAQLEAWAVPPGCTRVEQCLLIAENETKGFLRLVKFHGVEQELMRPGGHVWDSGGLFDFDTYVDDARAVTRELYKRGWVGHAPPTDYAWGGFEVCESIVNGPDGVVIGLLQPKGKILIDLPPRTGMSRTFVAAHVVRDYAESMRFFREVLGFSPLVDTHVDPVPPEMRRMLGMPVGQPEHFAMDVSIMHPQGGNDGAAELICMAALKGLDFSQRCVAPNLGLFAQRFPVEDATALAALFESRGARLFARPQRFTITPYGEVTIFSLRTPDGVTMEFYSPA